jgi:hypothetical protein
MELKLKYFSRNILLAFLFICFTKSYSIDYALYEYLQTDNSNFSISISLDKQDFLQGENIWLTVKIKNESGKIDSLPQLDKYVLMEGISIKNLSRGAVLLQYHGAMVDYSGIRYEVFQPNEEKVFEYELQHIYGDNFPKGSHDYSHYFSAGNYELSQSFSYQKYVNPALISNKVLFNVKEPTGIEKEAFNELIKIYQIPLGDVKPKSKNQTDAYITFMKIFPNSVYLERAMDYSLINRDIEGYKFDETFIADGLEYIDRNPDSRICSAIIHYTIRLMKSTKAENEIIEFLKDLSKKYPNTRTKTYIDQHISEIKNIPEYKY